MQGKIELFDFRVFLDSLSLDVSVNRDLIPTVQFMDLLPLDLKVLALKSDDKHKTIGSGIEFLSRNDCFRVFKLAPLYIYFCTMKGHKFCGLGIDVHPLLVDAYRNSGKPQTYKQSADLENAYREVLGKINIIITITHISGLIDDVVCLDQYQGVQHKQTDATNDVIVLQDSSTSTMKRQKRKATTHVFDPFPDLLYMYEDYQTAANDFIVEAIPVGEKADMAISARNYVKHKQLQELRREIDVNQNIMEESEYNHINSSNEAFNTPSEFSDSDETLGTQDLLREIRRTLGITDPVRRKRPKPTNYDPTITKQSANVQITQHPLDLDAKKEKPKEPKYKEIGGDTLSRLNRKAVPKQEEIPKQPRKRVTTYRLAELATKKPELPPPEPSPPPAPKPKRLQPILMKVQTEKPKKEEKPIDLNAKPKKSQNLIRKKQQVTSTEIISIKTNEIPQRKKSPSPTNPNLKKAKSQTILEKVQPKQTSETDSKQKVQTKEKGANLPKEKTSKQTPSTTTKQKEKQPPLPQKSQTKDKTQTKEKEKTSTKEKVQNKEKQKSSSKEKEKNSTKEKVQNKDKEKVEVVVPEPVKEKEQKGEPLNQTDVPTKEPIEEKRGSSKSSTPEKEKEKEKQNNSFSENSSFDSFASSPSKDKDNKDKTDTIVVDSFESESKKDKTETIVVDSFESESKKDKTDTIVVDSFESESKTGKTDTVIDDIPSKDVSSDLHISDSFGSTNSTKKKPVDSSKKESTILSDTFDTSSVVVVQQEEKKQKTDSIGVSDSFDDTSTVVEEKKEELKQTKEELSETFSDTSNIITQDDKNKVKSDFSDETFTDTSNIISEKSKTAENHKDDFSDETFTDESTVANDNNKSDSDSTSIMDSFGSKDSKKNVLAEEPVIDSGGKKEIDVGTDSSLGPPLNPDSFNSQKTKPKSDEDTFAFTSDDDDSITVGSDDNSLIATLTNDQEKQLDEDIQGDELMNLMNTENIEAKKSGTNTSEDTSKASTNGNSILSDFDL